MSVSPRQNFLKPPPVPETPTVTRTLPRFWIWNSSAYASEIGNTVLEPSILIAACAWARPGAPTASRPSASAGRVICCQESFMKGILCCGSAKGGCPGGCRAVCRPTVTAL